MITSKAATIAADIVSSYPDAANIAGLTGAIEAAVRAAILEERSECAALSRSYDDGETSNKPEHSSEVHATKFTIKAMANTIADGIAGRPKP